MKHLKKIAGINLVVILIYSAIIRLLSGGGNGASTSILIMSAFAVGFHVLICFIIAALVYANKNKEVGNAWLLSAGIVLLVGFSTCLGNAML